MPLTTASAQAELRDGHPALQLKWVTQAQFAGYYAAEPGLLG